jgi:hypothetical protein
VENNCAIRAASYYGHIAVVEKLLQDPRVDPCADDNYAIRQAFKNGHLAVVERLLKDKRIKLPWLLYTQMCAYVWFRKAYIYIGLMLANRGRTIHGSSGRGS